MNRSFQHHQRLRQETRQQGRQIGVARLLVVVMLLSGLLPMAQAQTANTGVITGVVKDETGAVVQNATVKAVNKGTNVERRTTTSDEGAYELAQLVPGEYRVEIEASRSEERRVGKEWRAE